VESKFFLRSYHLLSHSRNPPHFTEPEGSLPSKILLILSSSSCLCLPSYLFPFDKIPYAFHFFPIPATCLAQLILFDLIVLIIFTASRVHEICMVLILCSNLTSGKNSFDILSDVLLILAKDRRMSV
jgi:hypothetical protein